MSARLLPALLLAVALPAGAGAAEGRWGTPEQCRLDPAPGTFVAPSEAPYELRDGWLSRGFMHCRLTRLGTPEDAPATVAGFYGARCGEDGVNRDYRLRLVEEDGVLTMLWSPVDGPGFPPHVVGPLAACMPGGGGDG